MTPPRLAVPATPGDVVRVRVARPAARAHRRRAVRMPATGRSVGGYVLRLVGRDGDRVTAPVHRPRPASAHRVPVAR